MIGPSVGTALQMVSKLVSCTKEHKAMRHGKQTFIAVLFAVVSMILAACGGGGATPAAPPAGEATAAAPAGGGATAAPAAGGASAGGVEIRYQLWDSNQQPAYQACADEF